MGRCRGTVDTEGHLTEADVRSDVSLGDCETSRGTFIKEPRDTNYPIYLRD